jgi:hypothetical protein
LQVTFAGRWLSHQSGQALPELHLVSELPPALGQGLVA